MRRFTVVLSGLAALVLLDPAVTAWAERQQATHLAQHSALAVCGILLALTARPLPRRTKAARKEAAPVAAGS